MSIKLKKNAVKKVQEGVKIKGNANNTNCNNIVGEGLEKVFYFKESIVDQIKSNSYESLIESVQAMAYKNIKKIVGENCQSNLHFVSTFKNHAIVADDSSNLYRLHFSESEGQYKLNKVEEVVDIKKYDLDTLSSKVESELTKSLISLSEGDESVDVKSSFSKMLEFKKSGFVENYVQLVKQEDKKNNTEELK